MSEVIYEIVEHDGGWAYKSGGAFSETFATHEAALAAAKRAAAEQQVGGQTDGIVYEDERGNWREELSDGDDRPQTRVVDKD